MSNHSKTYQLITQESFQRSIIEKKQPSILVFGAEWSGNAEIMNSMMERISKEFDGHVTFYEVDIEKHPDIATFFGVTSIPMTIMLKEGEVLGLVKGFTSANNIRKKIRNNYSDTQDNNSSQVSN